jgi:hypothetical protein
VRRDATPPSPSDLVMPLLDMTAGADIKEMRDKTCASTFITGSRVSQVSFPPVAEVYKSKFLENWGTVGTIRKPIIAAVSGFAVSLIKDVSFVHQ